MEKLYTLLIIDSNTLNFKTIKEMVGDSYNVISANSAMEAISISRVLLPDLIFVNVNDINLAIDELKLLKNVDTSANIPVLLMIDLLDIAQIPQEVNQYIDDFVSKPFVYNELILRIKNHIKFKSSKQEYFKEKQTSNTLQKELNKIQTTYKIISESTSDAIIIFDKNLKIEYVTANFVKIFGVNSKNILGKNIREINIRPRAITYITNFLRDIEQKRLKIERFCYYNPIAQKRTFLESRCTAVFENGVYCGISISTSDISNQVKNQQFGIRNFKTKIAARELSLNGLKNNVYQTVSFVVNVMFEAMDADELLVLLANKKGERYAFVRNKNFSEVQTIKLEKGSNINNEFSSFLAQNDKIPIINADIPIIPQSISKRYKLYACHPIVNHNQLCGLVYIGTNNPNNFSNELIYNAGATANNLKNLLYKLINEKKFVDKENEARNIFKYSSNAMLTIDEQNNIQRFNLSLLKLFGFTNEILGKNIDEVFSGKFLKDLKELLSRKSDLEDFATAQLVYKSNQDKFLYLDIAINQILESKKGTTRLIMFNDVTSLKEIDRMIYTAISKTEERERTRMAMELHDGMGALLSSINIYINLILNQTVGQDEFIPTLQIAMAMLQEAISNCKELANNLHPVMLKRFGLKDTVEQHLEKIISAKIINIEKEIDQINLENNRDQELSIYRIVTELINNTLKYAKAKTISLKILRKDNNICIQYKDDGIGFDVEKINNPGKKSSMGLNNILARVRAMDGEYDFQSKENFGVKVWIEIPIK